MKKTTSVARNVLRLLFRSGTAWGLIGVVDLLAAFMFTFARSDGVLANELQIRIRYGLFFSVGLLNLALMYLSCTSLRRDIDERQFHTVSVAPVHRCEIWLGKYLGVLCLGLIALLSAVATLAVCCAVMISTWDKAPDREALKDRFYRARYSCRPDLDTPRQLVAREYKRLQIEGALSTDKPAWQVKQELRDSLRKKEQMLAPGGAKQWTFRWHPGRARGQFATLKVKFYTEQRRSIIRGTWTLDAAGRPERWTAPFSGYPYIFHEISVPLPDIPDAPVLRLTFQGHDTPHLIFPRSGGVALLYDSGGIGQNLAVLCLFCLLHAAVLIAVGLALGALFSYPVAVFVNVVLYAVGVSSGFFANVVRNLMYEEPGLAVFLSGILLRLGLWLTKGVTAPPVIDRFSSGLAIPVIDVFRGWGLSATLYALVAAGLGVLVLTRKELDKILES